MTNIRSFLLVCYDKTKEKSRQKNVKNYNAKRLT